MEYEKLISSVGLLSSAYSMLKPNSREVIQRSTIQSVASILGLVTERVKEFESIVGEEEKLYLQTASAYTDGLLSSSVVNEFDSDIRKEIIDNINKTTIAISLSIGKYFTNNELDFDIRLEQIIFNICKTCINNGYYFELEGERNE